MTNYFFTNILNKKIHSFIPVFKHENGYAMKIDIEEMVKKEKVTKEFQFYLSFLNDKDEKMSLNELDATYINFFISEYKKFISNINHKGSRNFLAKIKNDLIIFRKTLLNRQFSIFNLLSLLNSPIFFDIRIYTLDESDNSCIAETHLGQGSILNILNEKYHNIGLLHFAIQNSKMVLRSSQIEFEYSLDLIKRLSIYFRAIISVGIVILNIYLLKPLEDFPWNFVKFGISLIGIPLSWWLFNMVFSYIIERKLSAIWRSDRNTDKKKSSRVSYY